MVSMDSSVQNQLTNGVTTMKVHTFKGDVAKVKAAIATLEAIAGQIETVAWILEGIQETDTTTTDHDAFIGCVQDEAEELENAKDNLDALSMDLLRLCWKHEATAQHEITEMIKQLKKASLNHDLCGRHGSKAQLDIKASIANLKEVK